MLDCPPVILCPETKIAITFRIFDGNELQRFGGLELSTEEFVLWVQFQSCDIVARCTAVVFFLCAFVPFKLCHVTCIF